MLVTQVGQATPSATRENSTVERWPPASTLGPTPTARATSWVCSPWLCTSPPASPTEALSASTGGGDVAVPGGSTTRVPWIMFMPQANSNRPACSGVNSTVVWVNAGSDLEI